MKLRTSKFKKAVAFLCILAMVFSIFPLTSIQTRADDFGQIFNLSNQTAMDFSNYSRIYGTDKAEGSQYRYLNVCTVDGKSIYAVVTIKGSTGTATVKELDAASSTTLKRFEPTIKTTDASGEGDITFVFDFFVADDTNYTNDSPAWLKNFYLTAVDLDGSGGDSEDRKSEYCMISGYDTYIVSNVSVATGLKITSSGGLTRFQGAIANVDNRPFKKETSFIANYTLPVKSIKVVLGNRKLNAERLFSVNFGMHPKDDESLKNEYNADEASFTAPPVSNPDQANISIDVSFGDEEYGYLKKAEMEAIDINGTATGVGSGTIVTLVISDSRGNTVNTTATTGAGGAYSTTVDLRALTAGPVTVTAGVVNANGTPASASNSSKKKVTVTFDANGGNALEPGTRDTDDNGYINPPEPTRAENTFVEWNTAAAGTGTIFNSTTTSTADKTVYAQWRATVTFDGNGGTKAGNATETVQVTYGGANGAVSMLPSGFTRNGYTFDKWYLDAVEKTAEFTTSSEVTGNTSVYAHWTPNPVTVTFDYEGGTTGIASQIKQVGGKYGIASDGTTEELLPITSKAGFSFGGWYTEDGGEGTKVTDASDVTNYNNHTLYAKWTENPKTVTFDGNEGTVQAGQETKDVTNGSPAGDLPTPTRPGYDFAGWNTAASGVEGSSFTDTTLVTDDITVYAQWTAKTITVSFDAEEGTVTPTSQSKQFDSTYGKASDGATAQELPVPTRSGYNFAGWYTGDNGTGTQVTDATQVTNPVDHNLYAKWTEDLKTVTFDGNEGTVPAGQETKDVTNGSPAGDLPTPTRPGYDFAGWNTAASGVEGSSFTDATLVTDDITVYARWTAKTITVSFDAEGGTVTPASQSKQFNSTYGKASDGTAVQVLPVPTRSGYSFAGWYTGDNGTGTRVTDTTQVTNPVNHTLYAKWTRVVEDTAPVAPVSPTPTAPKVEYKSTEPDVLLKTTDGKAVPFMDYGKITIDLPAGNVQQGPKAAIDNNGKVEIQGLEKSKSYDFNIYFELKPGVKIVVGHLNVEVDANGSTTVEKSLIDPYGTLTDTLSGEVVPGALIKLYYADTERNRKNNLTPGTLVDLPVLKDFEPNENRNPQYSDELGRYAYMVYPYTDYYVTAELPGYKGFKSPIIKVEEEIVEFNIDFEPSEIRDLAVFVTAEKNKAAENSTLQFTLDYYNKNITDTENTVLTFTIPQGFAVVNSEGGKVTGNKIVWELGTLKAKSNGTKKVTLKVPTLSQGELVYRFDSEITAAGKLYFKDDDTSLIKVLAYSNRYEILHKRYILGYPDHTFKPQNQLTRSEAAAIFARILELKSTVKGEQLYTDVNSKHWAAGYIEAVSKKGLFTGYTDGSFKPESPITRVELATVIARILEVEKSSKTPMISSHYGDLDSNYARNTIESLTRFGILEGIGDKDKKFLPNQPIRRDEAVTMINRMLFRGPLTGAGNTFPDMTSKNWGFENAEEAIRTHKTQWLDNGTEKMIDYIDEDLW